MGVVFYILLTGESPWHQENDEITLSQNKECKIDFLSRNLRLVDNIAIDLLKKMLEKNPLNRIDVEEALKYHKFFSQNYQYDDLALECPSNTVSRLGNQIGKPGRSGKEPEVVSELRTKKNKNNQKNVLNIPQVQASPRGNIKENRSILAVVSKEDITKTDNSKQKDLDSYKKDTLSPTNLGLNRNVQLDNIITLKTNKDKQGSGQNSSTYKPHNCSSLNNEFEFIEEKNPN